MQAAGLDPETDLAEIIDAGGPAGVIIAAYSGDCDAGSTFVAVFLNLASTEDGLAILNTVYSWSGMQVAEYSFYDGFRQQLEAAGMNIEDLAGG